MKQYAVFVCETCGYKHKNRDVMLEHEAMHLGLTTEEHEQYKALKSFATYMGHVIACRNNNDDTQHEFNEAIKKLVTFKREHNIDGYKHNGRDGKYVYAFINVHNMVSVVNYDAGNNEVNSFLSKFDGWGNIGQFKVSGDNNRQEVWFECRKEIWDLFHSDVFMNIFKRMGVELVFERPYD